MHFRTRRPHPVLSHPPKNYHKEPHNTVCWSRRSQELAEPAARLVALLPHPKLSLCDGTTSDVREPYSPVQYTAALLVTTIQLVYGAQWSVSSTFFHNTLDGVAPVPNPNPP